MGCCRQYSGWSAVCTPLTYQNRWYMPRTVCTPLIRIGGTPRNYADLDNGRLAVCTPLIRTGGTPRNYVNLDNGWSTVCTPLTRTGGTPRNYVDLDNGRSAVCMPEISGPSGNDSMLQNKLSRCTQAYA